MAGSAEKRSALRNRYEEGFRVLQGQREYVTYPEDASFRMWYSDVPWRYDPHTHSAVEIVMTLEGQVDYLTEERTWQVQKDEILIIPPGMTHGLNMEQGSSRLLFLFEPDVLQSLLDWKRQGAFLERVFYLHDGSEAHTQIRELLLEAAELYRNRDSMWNTLCFSLLLRVYAILAREYLADAQIPGRREGTSSMDREVVAAAMNYINNHYQENLTLDDVAGFIGFSRFYFSRSFKQQTGFSFKDYLIRKRVQVAMGLLIETNLSMKDIAQRSGFGSVATFNRVFREQKQCTPSQYITIYGR